MPKQKNMANVIENYILSSKIHDYYQLPSKSQEEIIEEERDYFALKLDASLALSKDGKIVKGIQKRIITSVRNSFKMRCFHGYDITDTFVSISSVSQDNSSAIFRLKSLNSLLDKTYSKEIRIFSSTMNNGYSRLAARMDEKGAVVYVHKSLLYLSAFNMLAPFVKDESDRDWLLNYMQRVIDEKPEVHF